MLVSIIVVSFGAAAVAAAPGYRPPSPQPKCHAFASHVANFDDIQTIPRTSLNPIPTPYEGLLFDGLVADNVIKTGITGGTFPHSGNTFAAAGVDTSLKPKLSIDYPMSQYGSFDLHGFYYGCNLNTANGEASIVPKCVVYVVGYKGGDNTGSTNIACYERLTYEPDLKLLGGTQMAKADFGKRCSGITYAEITYNLEGVASALSALDTIALDDVSYTLNKCSQT